MSKCKKEPSLNLSDRAKKANMPVEQYCQRDDLEGEAKVQCKLWHAVQSLVNQKDNKSKKNDEEAKESD